MKTLEEQIQDFDYLENVKDKIRNKMINDQKLITLIISIVITILFFIYLASIYGADFSSILKRLLVFLILLNIISIIFKRKILPIGKISKNKIRKMCKYLYLPERSPEVTLSQAKYYEETAEMEKIAIDELKDFLKDLEISEGQKLSRAQKVAIEQKKWMINQVINEKYERIDGSIRSAARLREFASFLEKALTK